VIQDNDEPLAVLLKDEHFLAMEEKIGDEEQVGCLFSVASRTTRRAAWLESSVVCPGWVGFQQVLSERDAHRRAYICREGVAANGTAMQVVVANQVRFGLPVLCHADSLLGC